MSAKKSRQKKKRAIPLQKVWVPSARRGYESCVLDSKLPIGARLQILATLKRKFEPSLQFLARLVRDLDTPAKLRLAASDILAEVGAPAYRQELARSRELIQKVKARKSGICTETVQEKKP
jgi:hypothetical protein